VPFRICIEDGRNIRRAIVRRKYCSADSQRQLAQPVSDVSRSFSVRRGAALSARGTAIAATLVLVLVNTALAADPDLERAERLVAEKRYQEAYDLLAPFGESMAHNGNFNYLAGRAALGTHQAEKAQALLTRSLELQPDLVAAHLALGRAYFELGMYAEANIAFETVFRFDNLPPDLESQARIYARAAESYLEEGARLVGHGYAVTGVGQYRVNSTRGTNALGGGDRRDTFYNARVGGGLNYELQDNYALDASLDYRFRYYDNPESRNDSDLRWRAAGSRSFGENNLAIGLRGRTSYRGNGNYRNDYGLFTDYRYRLDPDNQLTTGAELRRRRYPEALSNRSFSSAVANVGWVHALQGGESSISLVAHGGYNFATNRPDGDSVVYGLTATYDFTLTQTLGGFLFGWWEHDSYDTDRIHFHPDAVDQSVILTRQDNLYEVGAGLVWSFLPGWSLRPEILYIRDQSNAVAFNYSSTEAWINVRVDF
jgi:tetratricopeptide (TPR) repeat protein